PDPGNRVAPSPDRLVAVLLTLARCRPSEGFPCLLLGGVHHARRDHLQDGVTNEDRAAPIDELAKVALVRLHPTFALAVNEFFELVLMLDIGIGLQVERIASDVNHVLVNRHDSKAVSDAAPTTGNL